jgi:hypothetical protein
MATSYPEGKTFLDTLKRSFTDVKVDASKDNSINTTEFLEAAESLTTLFGTPLFYNPTNRVPESWYCQECDRDTGG